MGFLRYCVVGTRLSGESMTSDGNTYINYIVQKFVFEELFRVLASVHPNGDDSSTGLTSYIPLDELK